jgi:signal transduction histidine kinase
VPLQLFRSATPRAVARLVAAGLVAALAVAVAGPLFERARFGPDDRASIAKIDAELGDRFDSSAGRLGTLAAVFEASHELVRDAARDLSAARHLFERADAALLPQERATTGITIYDAATVPLAWAGRVSDVPRERIDGPPAFFVTLSAPGPRLVRAQPIIDPERPVSQRIGTVVVERLLGEPPVVPDAANGFALSTAIVPVTLRARANEAVDASSYRLPIPTTAGELLVEAEVAPGDLASARQDWRRLTNAWTLGTLALTALLACIPLDDLRRTTRNLRTATLVTLWIVGFLLTARVLAWYATTPLRGAEGGLAPVELLLGAVLAALLVWITFDLVERRRITRPRVRMASRTAGTALVTAALYFAAGVVGSAVLWGYERVLLRVLASASLDLLHFSLHVQDIRQITLSGALVLLHAAALWSAALAIRAVTVAWRRPRSTGLTAIALAAWALGAGGTLFLATRALDPVPRLPLAAAVAAAGLSAILLRPAQRRARRASQAARLLALYLVLLVPSIALYPSLHADVIAASERLIGSAYGPEAMMLRRNLRESLRGALDDVDALASLAASLPAGGDDAAPTTDEAFQIWSQTDLASARLTSAVELYAADGRLASRFALNLPDYSVTAYKAASCDWDIFEENSPFGPSERHLFRASRGICEGGQRRGAIVLRAMLDFETLPFISSDSLYLDALAPGPRGDARASALDLEFVVYGWSRAPLYVSGTSVWELPDPVFDRMIAAREPFWATLTQPGGETFRVHFLNDRDGIYAVGYPVVTPFGHLVNLAELVALAGVLFIALLAGGSLVRTTFSRTPSGGRALVREVRSSFYRKLFLAFVAVAVVPVVILALATRTYFATQLLAGLEEAAAQTATVARRLVEDYATLQQPRARGLELLDDRVMELVGRAIDEPVNLFSRGRLQATSERDLFASGLLPTRTPAEVYRQIVLDRLPTFVGEEDARGRQYLVAAAPVRSGESEAIVTVPQPLRRQQIDRQIDELDRRVLFAAILFVLLGASAGYWMAERIADPVNRLTRATRRIARGDLDLRIAATSSDELRRLVEDFNRMADDLKRQRSELERTKRLEAWAEAARQVAHDIKNPLTPIQLSAEHARRINADRGRPLSPALDECVNAILTQVKLLRQISAEFSSFASSPTARPEPTDLARLIDEVVAPYRTGLEGRISIALESPPDLPTLQLDRTLFARALTNVIENALHAMPGRGALTIRSFRPTPPNGRVAVEIADTGVGMDDDALRRIFEPYFSTKATGTGLGLTIAKRNVELNGGTIAVASERGRGTTVTLSLPVPPNENVEPRT